MSKANVLDGKTFGELVVMRRVENSKKGGTMCLCKCSCGQETIAYSYLLTSGRKTDCGCVGRRINSEIHAKHREHGTRLYHIWQAMKNRCYNRNFGRYIDYGGRGITVCKEWKDDFIAFRNWALANGYRDDLSIDRIDNDGNYTPDNCRWATAKEQSANKRPWGTNRGRK